MSTLKAASKFSFILVNSINIITIAITFVKKKGILNHILKNSPNKNLSIVYSSSIADWYSTNLDTILLSFLDVTLSFKIIAFDIPRIVSKAIATPTAISIPETGAKNTNRDVITYVI